MSDRCSANSDLMKVVRLNGDFRRNYGRILGAFLYLRSIRAIRPDPSWWKRLLFAASWVLALVQRQGWIG